MNWDPFQREALAELGHTLYRVRGANAQAVPESVEPATPARRAERTASPAASVTVDPLLRALLRAAGTDALPALDMESLRRDPAAKRALWPRLRALRAQARSR